MLRTSATRLNRRSVALAAVRRANVPYLADSRSMSLEILRARAGCLKNEFSNELSITANHLRPP